MKKLNVILLSLITLSGCGNNSIVSEDVSNETSPSESIITSEIQSEEESSVSLSQNEETSSYESIEVEEFIDIFDFEIEVGEKYYIGYETKQYSNLSISIQDESVASLNDYYVIGNKIGETTLTFEMNDIYQFVKVNVVEEGSLSDSFEFSMARLYGKNLVAFGDSVTANATLWDKGKVYADLFAEHYQMNLLKNYAIGGTTMTYMYPGSNIYKEYHNNSTVIDACRVVKNAATNNELSNVDYAFIAYGHNDQYFQPPVDVSGDENTVTSNYSTCNSFKGSYRFVIDVLREANPNIRIIVLNCTYSEYDKGYPSPYGNTYTYDDYREAAAEIATEKKTKYVDPWNFTKQFYDYQKGGVYYQDYVHLSSKGHQKLSEYIIDC